MRQRTSWTGVIALPLLTFTLLLKGIIPDAKWEGAQFHFLVVSFTALLSLAMALLIVRSATQLRDVRVLFLALTYLSIAGLFLVHALTTPGALVTGANPWIGFSARASLAAGALFFALSAAPWSTGQQRWIIGRQGFLIGAVLVVLLLYGAVALSDALVNGGASGAGGSADYGGYGDTASTAAGNLTTRFDFLASPVVSTLASLVTLGLLAVVIVRYRAIYQTAPSALVVALLISAIFLAQSQVSMTLATTWFASWWEYHLLMLAAFATTIIGLVQEYTETRSVQGVIEGLLIRDTLVQVQRGYTEVIVALVEAVEAKDPYTHGHTQRVAELALAIGRELRLPPEQLRVLNRSALLHDIGKIGVPDAILNKPGRLTTEEFATIKEHPERGYRMVANVRSLQAELSGIRFHHERLDGSGYPDGLRGDAIPLIARIIAVADVFDALTSPRSYRGPWLRDRALAQIDAESGTRLDAAAVIALHVVLQSEPFTNPMPLAREMMSDLGIPVS